MLNERLRPILEPITATAGRHLQRAHVTPNILTAMGIIATVLCGALVAAGRPVLAGILLIPSILIDMLDGAMARATGRVTVWGSFFDSVGDRLADGAVIAGIAWAARGGNDRTLAAALIALILTFLVPYARAKAEAIGYRVASGPGERAERSVLIIAGLIFGFEEAALWTLVGLALITFVGRCASVWRQSQGR